MSISQLPNWSVIKLSKKLDSPLLIYILIQIQQEKKMVFDAKAKHSHTNRLDNSWKCIKTAPVNQELEMIHYEKSSDRTRRTQSWKRPLFNKINSFSGNISINYRKTMAGANNYKKTEPNYHQVNQKEEYPQFRIQTQDLQNAAGLILTRFLHIPDSEFKKTKHDRPT